MRECHKSSLFILFNQHTYTFFVLMHVNDKALGQKVIVPAWFMVSSSDSESSSCLVKLLNFRSIPTACSCSNLNSVLLCSQKVHRMSYPSFDWGRKLEFPWRPMLDFLSSWTMSLLVPSAKLVLGCLSFFVFFTRYVLRVRIHFQQPWRHKSDKKSLLLCCSLVDCPHLSSQKLNAQQVNAHSVPDLSG